MTEHVQPLLQGVSDMVRRALEEDVGSGDVTSTLVPVSHRGAATVICRQHAVLCGTEWFDQVFAQLDDAVRTAWSAQDGDDLAPGQQVCAVTGPTRVLLTGERTALNFLQCLSGTATVTRQFTNALGGQRTRILDTRKTIPGLRAAQKYAVRCGGGKNHRMGLFDAVLIKENHILAAGSVTAAIRSSRAAYPELSVEVEVENLHELEEAIKAGADIILLDNFDAGMMRNAVTLNGGRAALEVSGGLELNQVREIAALGVDYISVGALTKHVQAVDFSMRLISHPDSPKS